MSLLVPEETLPELNLSAGLLKTPEKCFCFRYFFFP
jgi:hypothetical protein